MINLHDTIAAIATPRGEGGVGVIRISGPDAIPIATRIFKPVSLKCKWLSNRAYYGNVVDEEEILDDSLLTIFRSPASYTGDDTAEFSCHGGTHLLARVLELIISSGARLALPGEFTQRAFLNGKLDLAQAEAVRDQIRASTDSALRIAVTQRSGTLSREITEIRSELIGVVAAIEVTIDFSDEVGELDHVDISTRLKVVIKRIEQLLATSRSGRILSDGARIAITGRPNVGKSSLLNALLRYERAIVTEHAGTTRDVIEEKASISGIPVLAIDTAGIRETVDAVEKIGIHRAIESIQSADIVLFVFDGSDGWTDQDNEIFQTLDVERTIIVANKNDQMTDTRFAISQSEIHNIAPTVPVTSVSAVAGAGINTLEAIISEALVGGNSTGEDRIVVSNIRHVAALNLALSSLRLAEATSGQKLPGDFITIDVMTAVNSLGEITGETATEEIIHRIFHDFCVGK